MRTLALLLTLLTLSACCGDHPELCQGDPLPLDAGIAACWTEQRAPLRTESTSDGPRELSLLACQEVIDGDWSVILDQVENGVAVRMACMYLVLGGERAAAREGRG